MKQRVLSLPTRVVAVSFSRVGMFSRERGKRVRLLAYTGVDASSLEYTLDIFPIISIPNGSAKLRP